MLVCAFQFCLSLMYVCHEDHCVINAVGDQIDSTFGTWCFAAGVTHCDMLLHRDHTHTMVNKEALAIARVEEAYLARGKILAVAGFDKGPWGTWPSIIVSSVMWEDKGGYDDAEEEDENGDEEGGEQGWKEEDAEEDNDEDDAEAQDEEDDEEVGRRTGRMIGRRRSMQRRRRMRRRRRNMRGIMRRSMKMRKRLGRMMRRRRGRVMRRRPRRRRRRRRMIGRRRSMQRRMTRRWGGGLGG